MCALMIVGNLAARGVKKQPCELQAEAGLPSPRGQSDWLRPDNFHWRALFEISLHITNNADLDERHTPWMERTRRSLQKSHQQLRTVSLLSS